MAIYQLPAQLANQIAAGEVVERPSSVVKELVENSLDAGATTIQIEIEKGGSRRIRIRDDGGGIIRDDLELALSRHATSKIKSLDDLESIMSLGFRGEALASISSVSRLTLTSKPADQAEAWQAFCEGREMQVQVQPAAHPVGTTIDVEDLFFNTPARRKFLRTEKTEFGHIDEVVRRIALGCPSARIVLSHNGKKMRDYRPVRDNDGVSRLAAVAGSGFAKNALQIESAIEPWQLRGYIAPAEHCRHQGDIQYMYVNGRMMKDKLLNHAIRQAYAEQLAADRQPTYVLYLEVPPRDVDVNVHPAKHEVRFHQARQVHDFVLQSLRQALPAQSSMEVGDSYQPPPTHYYQKAPERSRVAVSEQWLTGSINPVKSARQSSLSAPLTPYPQVDGAQPQAAPLKGEEASDKQDTVAQNEWLSLLEHQYGIVRCANEVALVPVAKLHEAVLQRRLCHEWRQGIAGQPLLVPVQLSVEDAISEAERQALARFGVVLKALSEHQVVVMQVPATLRQRPVEHSILVLLEGIRQPDFDVDGQDPPTPPCMALLTWLARQGVQPAYSEQQAQYWWQQACSLGLASGALKFLDWRALVVREEQARGDER